MREWILKAAGAVLLLAAAGGYGLSRIREERLRLRELEAMAALVRTVRESIEHLSRPLPEIWARYADPFLEECGFLPVLREEGFAAALVRTGICSRDGDALREFAAALGKGYREEELALCRYTEERLEDRAQLLRKEAPARERLWRTIPWLAALSAVILLL